MAKVTVRLEGFDKLQRALEAAPDRVRTMASSVIGASAFAVAQRARSMVPVATGTLKASIEASRPTGSSLIGRVGVSSRDVSYWRFVEFGTIRMAARPFFRPAAESERDSFIQAMRGIGPRLERDLAGGRFT